MVLSQCCSCNVIGMASKAVLVVVLLMFHHLNLVVSLANSSYSLQQQPPSCHDEDRTALLQFFSSTSTQHSSCKPNVTAQSRDCCSWDGADCDEETGHVIGLYLPGCNFSGLVPSSLGNLRHLTYLTLPYNYFNGPISASLENLTQLTYLDLHDNQFSGSIPSFLGKLNKLECLYLFNNHFSGNIPYTLRNLTELITVELNLNRLSGPIPSWLGNLSTLGTLDLGSNHLQGSIHHDSLSNLIHLKHLYLNDNNFNGTLDMIMFEKLRDLAFLDLSRSQLEFISSNDSRVSLEALADLDLSGNKMHAKVPKWLLNSSTTSLRTLNISHNFLSGFDQSPGFVLPWIHLQLFDLSFNMLQGPLPIPPPTILYYGVSNNQLTGEISPAICNMSCLKVLDISNNNLGGKLQHCHGKLSRDLQVLNLGNNSFHGVLPQEYTNTSDLKMLDVSNNQLQGKLPRSLANCLQLELLVLSNNDFEDIFPFWLGTLHQLKLLAMNHNQFCGVIENLVSHHSFPSLTILDLSANNFTGEFPYECVLSGNSMGNIPVEHSTYMNIDVYIRDALVAYRSFDYSITITNKGVERYFSKINEGFMAIDLSSNKFEGKIPEFIGKLKGLRSLNISNNILSGPIPSSMGNLEHLEALDLSQNKLSGWIPQQLVQLGFLELFNVSNNNLTGPIPHGRQLDTFDHTSYDGNPGLWGDLLPRKCGNGRVPELPYSNVEESDSGSAGQFDFDWIFVVVGCGSGFIVGVALADFVITRRQDLFLKIVGMVRL